MGGLGLTYRGKKNWTCSLCDQRRGDDGHDPCFGHLPGIQFACCGHGGDGLCEAYLYFENGVRIGMIVTSISYDDDRHRIEVPGEKIREIINRYTSSETVGG